MSDRDPINPPVPVFLVPQPTPGGRPSVSGLLNELQSEGITRGVIPDSRAQNVTRYIPIFDKSDVLKPIQSSTQQVDETAPAPIAGFTSRITAPINQVIVIRSLSWTVVGPLAVAWRVRFVGREDSPLFFAQLEESGPAPTNGRIIGDTGSRLTNAFNQLLPVALLPGDDKYD